MSRTVPFEAVIRRASSEMPRPSSSRSSARSRAALSTAGTTRYVLSLIRRAADDTTTAHSITARECWEDDDAGGRDGPTEESRSEEEGPAHGQDNLRRRAHGRARDPAGQRAWDDARTV